MLFSLSSLNLILPFFLPTTLALARNLIPRSTPASPVLPPTPPTLSQDAIPKFISLPHASLNTALTNEPICLTDRTLWDPPIRSDCDALIENLLLYPTAMIKKLWRGSGTFPIWQQKYGTCKLFLFVKDPEPGVWAEDMFEEVALAVVGAKVLRACVGVKTPNLGGELAVGPNEKFVVVFSGNRAKKVTATS